MPPNFSEQELSTIKTDIQYLKTRTDNIFADVEEVKEDVKSINEKIHDHEDGLYAKLVKIETKAQSHQKIFDFIEKALWLVAGSAITLAIKILFGV